VSSRDAPCASNICYHASRRFRQEPQRDGNIIQDGLRFSYYVSWRAFAIAEILLALDAVVSLSFVRTGSGYPAPRSCPCRWVLASMSLSFCGAGRWVVWLQSLTP
jgi:hypothetical protein